MSPEALADFRAKLPEKLSVMLATPIDDGHRRCFWESVRLLEKTPDPAGHTYHFVSYPGDSLVTRIRNKILHEFFFNTAHDYLGFIDSDIDFLPSDAWRITAHRLPLVCALYGIKEPKLRWCMNSLPDELPDKITGLQKVGTAGTGWMWISRALVGAMIAAGTTWPHWKVNYIEDHSKQPRHWLFFDGVIEHPSLDPNPRGMSEDWAFCFFARQLGFDVWMDTRAIVLHEGNIMYPLECRRVTKEEADAQKIQNPDGSETHLGAPQKV